MRTRRSQRSSGQHVLAWSLALLALVALALFARFFVPNVFLHLAAPVWGAGDTLAARTRSLFSGFADARALAAKNAALAQEERVLLLENQTLKEKVADVTALIGTTTLAGQGILAPVTARPPTAPYDTLILAAGREGGVHLLMGAYGAAGAPLGVVVGATADFSRVRLFSAPGVATDAWVGPRRVPVALKGQGAGAFTAAVSQGSGVTVGDLVYLSGPGAVPIGRVAHIAGAASDPIATLAIAPLANLFSATWVELRETPASASSTVAGSL